MDKLEKAKKERTKVSLKIKTKKRKREEERKKKKSCRISSVASEGKSPPAAPNFYLTSSIRRTQKTALPSSAPVTAARAQTRYVLTAEPCPCLFFTVFLTRCTFQKHTHTQVRVKECVFLCQLFLLLVVPLNNPSEGKRAATISSIIPAAAP